LHDAVSGFDGSLNFEVMLWPEVLAFVRFIEDTLWPNHPVRFFSALSLEKNAPSDSASVMYLVEAGLL
jgi:hypothetical protein